MDALCLCCFVFKGEEVRVVKKKERKIVAGFLYLDFVVVVVWFSLAKRKARRRESCGMQCKEIKPLDLRYIFCCCYVRVCV